MSGERGLNYLIFAKAFLLLPAAEKTEIENEQRMKHLDKDGDGALNYDEAKSEMPDPALFDADKNQVISGEEFLSFLTAYNQEVIAMDPNLEFAMKQIKKYDRNNDGRLTVDEWSTMLIRPEGADSNNDGSITAEEYAAFRGRKK